jgi:hypothetical protein
LAIKILDMGIRRIKIKSVSTGGAVIVDRWMAWRRFEAKLATRGVGAVMMFSAIPPSWQCYLFEAIQA